MPVDEFGNERNWDNGYPGQYGDNLAAGVTMADTAMSAQNKLNNHSWTLHRQEMDRILATRASPAYSGLTRDDVAHPGEVGDTTRARPTRLPRGLVFSLKLLASLGIFMTVTMVLGYFTLGYLARSVPAANARNMHQSIQAMVVAIGTSREFHGRDISPPSAYISARSAAKTMTPAQMAKYLESASIRSSYSPLFLQSAYACIYDVACTDEFLRITQHDELTLLNSASLFLVERAEHGDESAAQDACIISVKCPLIRHSLSFARGTCALIAGPPTQSVAAKIQMNKLTGSPWFGVAERIAKITDFVDEIARS